MEKPECHFFHPLPVYDVVSNMSLTWHATLVMMKLVDVASMYADVAVFRSYLNSLSRI